MLHLISLGMILTVVIGAVVVGYLASQAQIINRIEVKIDRLVDRAK